MKRVIDFYLYSSISFFAAAASKNAFKSFFSLSALHHPNKQKCTKYWRIKSLGDKTSYFLSYFVFYVKHELQWAKLSTMPIGIPKKIFYMSDHLMPSENSNQHSWKIDFVNALFDGKFVGGSQYPQNVLLKQFHGTEMFSHIYHQTSHQRTHFLTILLQCSKMSFAKFS